MRTKDLKTNQMRRMEAANVSERFKDQDEYCEKIQSWFKSQKKRFEIALLEKPLKQESLLLGAESVYVRLSDVARDAFPAVEGICGFLRLLLNLICRKIEARRVASAQPGRVADDRGRQHVGLRYALGTIIRIQLPDTCWRNWNVKVLLN